LFRYYSFVQKTQPPPTPPPNRPQTPLFIFFPKNAGRVFAITIFFFFCFPPQFSRGFLLGFFFWFLGGGGLGGGEKVLGAGLGFIGGFVVGSCGVRFFPNFFCFFFFLTTTLPPHNPQVVCLCEFARGSFSDPPPT